VRGDGGSWTVRIGYPRELARYLVFKGSVSVEGISLTIAALQENLFELLYPEDLDGDQPVELRPNDPVNLE